MADNALLEWLNDVAQKHGLAGAGEAADPEATDDDTQAEYEKLGGDAALAKILTAEDRLFLTNLEKQRAKAMDWQKDRRRELNDRREFQAEQASEHAKNIRRYSEFDKREAPLLAPIAARVEALGDKLTTETGKELVHLVAKNRERVEWFAKFSKNAGKEAQMTRPMLELIDRRLADVDRIFEAVEQRIRDSRTELDNVLEIKAMSPAEKLERLRGGSKGQEEAQKKLEAEIDKIFKDGAAEDLAQDPFFEEDYGEYEATPIDWKPVEKLLAKVESTSRDDLAKPDPALAKIQEEYKEKGGDEALFKKRVASWKSHMEALNMRNKLGTHVSTATQERLTEARLALDQVEKELSELRATERETLSRLRELTGSAETGDLLSGQETAELQVLAREKKRLETDIANAEKLVPLRKRSIVNIEQLLEKERVDHEQIMDDDTAPMPPKPRSKDIHELPLRAKYEELMAG